MTRSYVHTAVGILMSTMGITGAFAFTPAALPSYVFTSPKLNALLYFADETEGVDAQDRKRMNKKCVVVAGATGYIGKAVVRESIDRGYRTIALVRSLEKIKSDDGQRLYGHAFKGAQIVEADVCNKEELTKILSGFQGVDAIVSCLASPVGTKKEAYAIDYQATSNLLNAGRNEKVNAKHFILLSAFCCRKPLLQLQQAKLKFEAELQQQSDLSYCIVRPTAFFKSVSGQLEGIKQGNPYVLFGDGTVTRCNPIAEQELAEFMLNSIDDKNMHGSILNIGGPDEPLTNQMLGEMMFAAAGLEPKFVYAPTWIFDVIIDSFQFLATLMKNEFLEDAAEYARIGKYYAVEDMLTVKPNEKYGKISMMDHYKKIASQGQDPFTPIRATAFIGKAIEALPILGGLSLPIGYVVTHQEIAQRLKASFDFSFALALSESLSTSQLKNDFMLTSLSNFQWIF